jgi:hypothetical protein
LNYKQTIESMKKNILVLAMTLLPVAGFAQSGTTGDLNWSLSGGTLTICEACKPTPAAYQTNINHR